MRGSEVCDDGNTVGGDGCAANCSLIEPGFDCITYSTTEPSVCGLTCPLISGNYYAPFQDLNCEVRGFGVKEGKFTTTTNSTTTATTTTTTTRSTTSTTTTTTTPATTTSRSRKRRTRKEEEEE